MGWLSDIWGSVTGSGSKQVAQQQQQLLQQQQQQYQQQQAEAERQRAAVAADEATRQARIRGGTSAIDQAFSQFNEPFYKTAQDKYSSYYLPQIDEQAAKTRDQLTASLFERGMLESSIGAGALGDLEKKRLDERGKVGSEAVNFAEGLRNQIAGQKNSLYDVARSAADPNQLAARAAGDAATLAQSPGGFTQTRGSLGDLFGSVLEPFAYYTVGKQNAVPGSYKASSGTGSSFKLFG